MMYKYYFSVLLCDRWISSFMRGCGLGIDEVGTSGEVSFITDLEPTKENKRKIEKLLETSKDEKSLKMYYSQVKCSRVEVVEEDELNENTGK